MSAVRLPDNPCPVKTVAWVAWEVLAGRTADGHPGHYFAFSVPVSREEIEVEVREEFRALTGKHHTLDTISRMIRGGDKGFLNFYAATVGYELQTPMDATGKHRLDGRVKMVRL